MAKFYIQSGEVSFVVTAQDAEGAALWAMHRVIDSMIDDSLESALAYEELGMDLPPMLPYEPVLDGLAEFGPQINVSECGFGYHEAGLLETENVFKQWRQLMSAAEQLFDQL